jgi:hypothetical protein
MHNSLLDEALDSLWILNLPDLHLLRAIKTKFTMTLYIRKRSAKQIPNSEEVSELKVTSQPHEPRRR